MGGVGGAGARVGVRVRWVGGRGGARVRVGGDRGGRRIGFARVGHVAHGGAEEKGDAESTKEEESV